MTLAEFRLSCVVLPLLLCLWSTIAVPLLPHGTEFGDTEWVPPANDEYTTVTFSKLDTGFPYAGGVKNDITIDENGNVNFEDDYFEQPGFPDIYDLIAPLWDDHDPGPAARIYYRETMDSDLLFDISLYVRQIHGVAEFWPVWAFVVTWKNHRRTAAEDLNFQAVIATDKNNESYAVFFYENLNNELHATVGVGKYDNTYDQLCVSNDEDGELVNRKQSICQGKSGIMSFRTDEIQHTGSCRNTLTSAESACAMDSDCLTGSTTHCPLCNINTATCVECLTDADCPTSGIPFCDASIGWCMACVSDDNCVTADPNLPYCDSTRMCRECFLHRHCTQDPYRICTSDYRCIECMGNSDCRDVTKPVCENETCVCLTDTDCGSNRLCDNTTRQCVCQTDNAPCNGPGMACDTNGRCTCLDGYVNINGNCVLDCDPPCADRETCSLDRRCLGDCIDPDADSCPAGRNAATLRGCAKRGRIGGYCAYGRCFDKGARCNRRTNKCGCYGGWKAQVMCHPRH